MTTYYDMKMTQQTDTTYDFDIENGQIVLDDTIETIIFNLLHTDKRASQFQVVDPRQRRGWPGDLTNTEGRQLGSHLWLLEQRRLTQNTLNEGRNYIEIALSPLVEDGIVSEISVTGMLVPQVGINYDIEVKVKDDTVKYYNVLLNLV